ncbi:hypothetical protein ACN4D5_06555 [Corynebacterium macclintockiae]|uniref:hypothetical protein n=1 Tax=Corynebacterium macclintockiae TaxID=2913501 RepID=UPI003EC0AD86
MAIKTVSLGKMRGEGWVFQPKEDTRYYLPKGDYTFLVAGEPYGSSYLDIIPSTRHFYSKKDRVYSAEIKGVEWFEFRGDILQVAIIPGAVMNKTPRATPTPNAATPPSGNPRGNFELDVLYKVGDTVTVRNQTPSINGTYECIEEHKSSFYDYPWNSARKWKKIRDANEG